MRLLPLLVVAAALVAGCGTGEERSVSELDAIDELRERFNADVGRPRLILLLSPS